MVSRFQQCLIFLFYIVILGEFIVNSDPSTSRAAMESQEMSATDTKNETPTAGGSGVQELLDEARAAPERFPPLPLDVHPVIDSDEPYDQHICSACACLSIGDPEDNIANFNESDNEAFDAAEIVSYSEASRASSPVWMMEELVVDEMIDGYLEEQMEEMRMDVDELDMLGPMQAEYYYGVRIRISYRLTRTSRSV